MKDSFFVRCRSLLTEIPHNPKVGLAVGSFSLGVLGVFLGIFLFLKEGVSSPIGLETDKPEEAGGLPTSLQTSSSSAVLFVDVSGAVKKPGVYGLPQDSRIFTALEKAGGLDQDADIEAIQKSINLAEKVKEGQKIYFFSSQKETDTQVASADGKTGIGNLISINSASAAELDTLPGIGEKSVSKIIDGRPYQNVLELTTRIKIGESVFEKIKDQIKI